MNHGFEIGEMWKSRIVVACITCERVVLFTAMEGSLEMEGYDELSHIFLPTVCFSCEKDERARTAVGKDSKETSMPSIALSPNMLWAWQPFLTMLEYLEGELSLLSSKQPGSVAVLHRDKIKELIKPEYIIQSVSLTREGANVLPYLGSGFF
jgi:hypothetical protein